MEDDVRADAEGTVDRWEYRVLQEPAVAQKVGHAQKVDRHREHDEKDVLCAPGGSPGGLRW